MSLGRKSFEIFSCRRYCDVGSDSRLAQSQSALQTKHRPCYFGEVVMIQETTSSAETLEQNKCKHWRIMQTEEKTERRFSGCHNANRLLKIPRTMHFSQAGTNCYRVTANQVQYRKPEQWLHTGPCWAGLYLRVKLGKACSGSVTPKCFAERRHIRRASFIGKTTMSSKHCWKVCRVVYQ